MPDFKFSDFAQTTLSAATNKADGTRILVQKLESVVDYLQSPGSGPDATTKKEADMPIFFQALSNSSYDPISRISIPRPRVLPADLEDGRPGREYQYSLVRDGEFLDGLGCYGSETTIGKGAAREWAYTIDGGMNT